MSRYDLPCPACGALIPHGHSRGKPIFPCPACGESLKLHSWLSHVIFAVSFLGAPLLAWYLGYQGWRLALVAGGISLLVLVFGFFLMALVILPNYKRVHYDKSKPFDRVVSLHLTDKPDANKKIAP